MITVEFEIPMTAIGKPRMTKRDRWAKRKCVVNYFAWANNMRLLAPMDKLPVFPKIIDIIAWMPMPKSWSRKKRELKDAMLHDEKPDWDNIGKAVCDVLFGEDKFIGCGSVRKYWHNGEGKVFIKVMGNYENIVD
jgi:Holliday junction resolvase RusA-like endonuclease